MSQPKLLSTLASIGIFCACGCTSSENEPLDPPKVPEIPETPVEEEVHGVGLSRTNAYIGTFSTHDNDTIEIKTDDWMISSVSFCNEKHFIAPYLYPLTTYMTDFSGAAPFDETLSWLHMEYSEGRLMLSDVDPFIVDEWPEYRYAFVEFERNGEVADTLICKDQAEMPMGRPNLGPNPGRVIFQKAGGSVNLKTSQPGWVFRWLDVDGVRHTFSEDDGTQNFEESWTNTDFSFTFDWVTIERNKYGDPAEITVTVTPNESGLERTFDCGIGPWAVWGVFHGLQSAD